MTLLNPILFIVCSVSDDCRSVMDLIRFLSTFAFLRYALFAIGAAHGILTCLDYIQDTDQTELLPKLSVVSVLSSHLFNLHIVICNFCHLLLFLSIVDCPPPP